MDMNTQPDQVRSGQGWMDAGTRESIRLLASLMSMTGAALLPSDREDGLLWVLEGSEGGETRFHGAAFGAGGLAVEAVSAPLLLGWSPLVLLPSLWTGPQAALAMARAQGITSHKASAKGEA